MKRTTIEQARPIMNGCHDEWQEIAVARLDRYCEPPDGSIDAAKQFSDIEQDVDAAYESWSNQYDDTPEKRAALLRLAAVVALALTVDELVRGSDACEKLQKSLDPLGYPKTKNSSNRITSKSVQKR